MSTLTNKNILVVGDENSQIHNLEENLTAHGIIIHTLACDSVTPEKVNELKIDLILLNHLHDGQVCKDMLDRIRKSPDVKTLPVLALVNESPDSIQDVLMRGATDYLTDKEETESVVSKIKVLLGQDVTSADSSVIDISPSKARVTSTGIRVFVVEDDPLLRNLLSIRLEKSSFPHEFSPDGSGVITSLEQFKPDIIILDLMLPGRDGLEILSEIKSDDTVKDIPVIVFSNKDGQNERNKAKELGAEAFFVKAMTDLSELIETIESVVKK